MDIYYIGPRQLRRLDYMSKRQAPSIRAAVPVHTPLSITRKSVSQQSTAAKKTRKKESRGGGNSHQPLQRRKLHRLDPLPQPSHLLLNARLRLLDAHFLTRSLLADTALLEVEIEADGGLGAGDLVAEPAGQLGEVGAEPVV